MPTKRQYHFVPFPAANVGLANDAVLGIWASVASPDYQKLIPTFDQDPTKYKTFTLHHATAWGNGEVMSVNVEDYQDTLITYENKHLSDSDQVSIYIDGHCAAGSKVLQSPDHKLTIDASDLAALFKKLDKKFAGKIKIWGCSSGASQGNIQAFTQLFADAMGKLGFAKCHYYGYTETINGLNVPKSLGETPHRWADSGLRASEVRKEFFATKVSTSCNVM